MHHENLVKQLSSRSEGPPQSQEIRNKFLVSNQNKMSSCGKAVTSIKDKTLAKTFKSRIVLKYRVISWIYNNQVSKVLVISSTVTGKTRKKSMINRRTSFNLTNIALRKVQIWKEGAFGRFTVHQKVPSMLN